VNDLIANLRDRMERDALRERLTREARENIARVRSIQRSQASDSVLALPPFASRGWPDSLESDYGWVLRRWWPSTWVSALLSA